jgi:hypothetical protein
MGPGFSIVRSDVGGNIDRLSAAAAIKPEVYAHDIFQIVRDEVASGTQGGSSSCTKGLLWLKRCAKIWHGSRWAARWAGASARRR